MSDRPFKILHVCKAYLPVKGGVQRVVKLLTDTIHSAEHHVLTTGDDGAIKNQIIDGTHIKRCRSYAQIASLPFAPNLVFTLMREARNYDVVAVHYPFPLAYIGLSLNLSRKPIVVHWHSNIVAQRNLRWLVIPFTWVLLIRASAIVVTHRAMIANSVLLKIFRKKVIVVPYGIKSLNQAVSLTKARPYLVVVGRQVAYKGIDVAIRALQHCNARLRIIGDGPLFERHEQLAANLGVSARIKFIRHADDQEVIAQIAQSSGLVLSSTSENEAFALVQLEAMRLAKPVINTNLKSTVPHVARHKQEGLTVSPNNPSELANAMQQLLDEPNFAAKLGNAGKLRFETMFSVDAFGVAMEHLYRSVLRI